MRLAIISDIHSNLEALTKALELIKTQKVDEVICLGDIVGYGANPNECIELVQQHCTTVLLGNHDRAALDLALTKTFTTNARVSAQWTYQALTEASKQYLRSLPMTSRFPEMFFVHASPHEPEEWHYILSILDAQPALRSFSEPICFIGHTHVPAIYTESGRFAHVDKRIKSLVNVGSIGQPRDGNPMLSYGLFDADRWFYENIRDDYDVEAAGEKILAVGLPRALADRLLVGV